MSEEIESGPPPATLKEYLKSTAEVAAVFKWVWVEVVTPESLGWIWKMNAWVLVTIIMQAIQPGFTGLIFTGLALQNVNLVEWGVSGAFVCMVLQRLASRYHERAREWVMGLHWQTLDDRLTELFLNKSLAQHAAQASLLAPTNIDKGKWRILDMQRMIFFDAVPAILLLVISFVCLLVLNWVSGLIMLGVIAIYMVSSLYMNSLVARICTPLDRRFRRLNRRRFERWDRVERVKVAGKESKETKEMSGSFAVIMKDDRNFWLTFIDIAFLRALTNFSAFTLVMAWGAYLVWHHQLALGMLYPLYMWSSRVSDNIWRLGDIEHQINWNLPSVQSMIKAVSLKPTVQDVANPKVIDPKVPHIIEFCDVSHSYGIDPDSLTKPEMVEGSAIGSASVPTVETPEESEAPAALSKISFTLAPGEKVALLGPSGAGKSTLMKKLLRFDDPTEGSIKIDGIDLREISQASWKQGIGYIPQQAQVFDGSIRYNLTYSLSDEEREVMTDDELWNLMRLLQIDFGKRLTHGLDTVVGKNGIKLSGGQAQRLMIGAAVAKKPWLLVVDEATSSLDSSTERLVQQGLEAVLSKGTTSALIVAHRLSTVRHLCNKFVMLRPISELEPGETQVEAVAQSFEELYEKSATFRRLADDQGVTISQGQLV